MSQRTVDVLSDFSPNLEVYSVDESFLQIELVLQLYPSATALGQQIRRRMKQWLGLPVCVGIGPTKPLAKLANHMSKKMLRFEGVCDLHAIPRPDRLQLMSEIEIGEVWGWGAEMRSDCRTWAFILCLICETPSPLKSANTSVSCWNAPARNCAACLAFNWKMFCPTSNRS